MFSSHIKKLRSRVGKIKYYKVLGYTVFSCPKLLYWIITIVLILFITIPLWVLIKINNIKTVGAVRLTSQFCSENQTLYSFILIV